MNKCLLCIGDKTDAILEKLEYNVGGIELEGCSNIKVLDAKLRNAGKIDSIIIFETAIDKENPEVPQTLKENNLINVIFVLNDPGLLEKYDIEFFVNKNVKIVDNKYNKVTFPFIKELIGNPNVDSHLLYKSGEITIEQQEEPDDSPQEETSVNLEEIQEKPVKRTVVSEDEPVVFKRSGSSSIDIEQSKPKRKISLEQDVVQTVALDKSSLLKNTDKIKDIVSVYQDGLVIVCCGTPRSYTTTFALNMAKYFALELDKTTAYIDLDLLKFGSNFVDERIYKGNAAEENVFQKTLRDGNIITNAFLLETNLQILTNSLFSDSFTYEEYKDKFIELLERNKKIYNIIIIDMQLKDLVSMKDIVSRSNKLIFNLSMSNQDLLALMRVTELCDDDLLARKIFESYYIQVNPVKEKLLRSKFNDIRSIDSFLEVNGFINERKYEDIKHIGSLIRDEKYVPNKYNKEEIEKIIISMFE